MTDKEVIDTLRGLVDMESGVGMHTEMVSLQPHQRIAIKEAVRMLAKVERLREIVQALDEGLILECPSCDYVWEYNQELRVKASAILAETDQK